MPVRGARRASAADSRTRCRPARFGRAVRWCGALRTADRADPVSLARTTSREEAKTEACLGRCLREQGDARSTGRVPGPRSRLRTRSAFGKQTSRTSSPRTIPTTVAPAGSAPAGVSRTSPARAQPAAQVSWCCRSASRHRRPSTANRISMHTPLPQPLRRTGCATPSDSPASHTGRPSSASSSSRERTGPSAARRRNH